MFRTLAAAFAVLAAFALTTQTADAGSRRHVDKRVVATGVVVGAAATATYFAINDWRWKWDASNTLSSGAAYGLTTVGCLALSPMVATVVVRRELTMREGHVLAGSCVLPIIGGLLVNAAYDANPHWEPKPKMVKVAKRSRKMKK